MRWCAMVAVAARKSSTVATLRADSGGRQWRGKWKEGRPQWWTVATDGGGAVRVGEFAAWALFFL